MRFAPLVLLLALFAGCGRAGPSAGISDSLATEPDAQRRESDWSQREESLIERRDLDWVQAEASQTKAINKYGEIGGGIDLSDSHTTP